MKKIKLFVVGLFLFIPINVWGYDLTCGENSYKNGEYFYCYITGKTNVEYEILSGTLTTDKNLSCAFDLNGTGLTKLDNTSDKAFSLQGFSTHENLAIYKCQVKAKPNEDISTQIKVEDFTYKIKGGNQENEVLRSKNIIIQKHVEETTTQKVDNKPRDTTNGDSLLRTLYSEKLDITFSKFITEYHVEVLYEVENINLTALAANNNATVKIEGDTNLKVGENVIDIYVTSPDNKSITCYTIYINRLPRGEEIYYPERDASLFSLNVLGYAIPFEKDQYEYGIHLKSDVSSIEVNAVATYKGAIIDISRTSNLENGSVVVITVTSKDMTNTLKYTIKITKDPEKKDYTMLIIIGVIIFLILIFSILIIRTLKKRNEDPILKLKHDKRKINKGSKFDSNKVPEAASSDNVIKENVNSPSVKPVEIKKVVPTNFNKITPVKDTVILSPSDKAAPIPMPNPNEITGETINPAPIQTSVVDELDELDILDIKDN